MPYMLIVILLFLPGTAFAYLDPGSGAVLINLIIAGIAALLYSLKGLLLRIMGKGSVKAVQKLACHLAILSEGSAYQHTFGPLVQELIKHEVHFSYYTLDISDPLLKVNNAYCHNRFLGFGALGKYRAGNLVEPTVLCTTPNIGCKGYPVKRSAKTKELIHVFHSLVDISMYQKGSLDCYDTVIVPGEYHNSPIREIEHKRGLKAKKLIALGSLYLDPLIAEMRQSHIPTQDRCILVASSWGDKGLLKQYGIQPFIELARKDWQVIMRPHPHSFKHEPDLINKLQRQSANIPNVVWDTKLSPVETMSRAVLMISDTSSVRFDFAFIYERPVLSLEIPVENMPGFERDDLNEIWSEKAAIQIGMVAGKDEVLGNLHKLVEQTLNEYDSERIRTYRDANVKNFGEAAKAIAQYLISEPSKG
ncbi:MAG: hypothetical protein PHY21_09465 [Candidatus Cloacimonetes bacterium]|nr:hypothetical protein [Candidatus Cloacimonadota bacterium]